MPLITLDLTPKHWSNLVPAQYGKVVSYLLGSPHILSVEVTRKEVKATLDLDWGTLAAADFNRENSDEWLREITAMIQIDPEPCPCGCGADLLLGECPVISGEATQEGFTQVELNFLKSNQKIAAIKEIRIRLGIGLRDAKDMCDAWYQKHGKRADGGFGHYVYDPPF